MSIKFKNFQNVPMCAMKQYFKQLRKNVAEEERRINKSSKKHRQNAEE